MEAKRLDAILRHTEQVLTSDWNYDYIYVNVPKMRAMEVQQFVDMTIAQRYTNVLNRTLQSASIVVS